MLLSFLLLTFGVTACVTNDAKKDESGLLADQKTQIRQTAQDKILEKGLLPEGVLLTTLPSIGKSFFVLGR